MPDEFYYPFFSLTASNLLDNKDETIKAFRKLEMIWPNDTPAQVEFYYSFYRQMIVLFAKPYMSSEFDFGRTEFFEELFSFGEKLAKMPEFKQARGVKHFIYVNRTNFGLYNILHELKANVKTDTYKPHVVDRFEADAVV
ncbi:hypothetical protein [Mucilaginibacter antarcticus]